MIKKITNLILAVLLLSSLTYFVPDKVKLVCISDEGVALYFSNKCKKHSQKEKEISKQFDPCKDVILHQNTPESLKKILFKKQERTKVPSYQIISIAREKIRPDQNRALAEKINHILSVKLLI